MRISEFLRLIFFVVSIVEVFSRWFTENVLIDFVELVRDRLNNVKAEI